MFHLIIDSSTKLLLVAITKSDQLLVKKTRVAKKDHSYYITEFIKEALKEANLKIEQIEDITVGSGPGSYTGLRVAGTAAKVLAYSLDKKLYQISSLYLLTSGYDEERLVLYDAKQERFFATKISKKDQVKLEDGLYEKKELPKAKNKIILTAENIDQVVKLDFKKILNQRNLVDHFKYSPNYALKTKAERDLEKTVNKK